jgi:DNA-binding NarL/FixJ family response regulator
VTTIVIADDNTTVRQILKSFFEEISDFTVVGEANSGLGTISVVKNSQPDVLVLDMLLGDLTGIEVAHQLLNESLKTRIIIYSMYGNRRYVSDAKQAGVRGYVLKTSPPHELIEAIHEITSGGTYFRN